MGMIYQRLAEARHNLRMTQRGISEAIGLSLRAYARYESGEGGREIPSSVLNYYAQNGININWLLTGDGHMIQPLDESQPAADTEPVDKETTELLKIWAKLDDDNKQAIMHTARQAERIALLLRERAG